MQGLRGFYSAPGRALWLSALALALVVVSAGIASASGPASFSGITPADGSSVTVSPVTVGARSDDTSPVVSGTLRVDGQAVSSQLLFPIGHWEGNGCDMWYVVDDYTVAELRAALDLPDGSYSASMTVTNAQGADSVTDWSFTVGAPPVIADLTPSGLAQTDRPTVSARVTDNGSGSIDTTMAIDGVTVPASFETSTGTLSFVPLHLEDGTHTVEVTATDPSGLTSIAQWSFAVRTRAYMTFSDYAPAEGSVVTAINPPIGVTVDDQYASIASAVATINGSAAPITITWPVSHWDGNGCESWLVIDDSTVARIAVNAPLLDGPNEVSVRTTNTEGFSQETTWTFTVATPPVIDQQTPTGVVATSSPEISARVSDNGGSSIDTTMTLDGVVVPATFSAASGLLAYTPAYLDDGTHTVEVTAMDATGLTAREEWSFALRTRAYMTFSAGSPAAGSVETSLNPVVGVTVDEEFADIASATAKLDGEPVPVTLEWPISHWDGNGCSSWQIIDDPTVARVAIGSVLTDGAHTLSVRVTNVEGFSEETSWDFTVAAPPVLEAPQPTPDSDVPTRTPAIGAGIRDNDSVPEQVEVRLDGTLLPADVDLASVSTTAPKLKDDTTHTVSISATDAAGLNARLNWKFRVEVLPDMTIGQCTDCHSLAAHPMNNCSNCHDPATGGHGAGITRPIENCGCHGGGAHAVKDVMANCTAMCHQRGYAPYVPDHPQPLENAHSFSVQSHSPRCSECHNRSLTREHNRYKNGQGASLHCATCHGETTSQRVKNAVAAGNRDCYACHDDHDHRASSVATVSAGDGRTCTECHDVDIVWEHGGKETSAGYGKRFCDDCHATGRPWSAPVAWDRTCDSEKACHRRQDSAQPIHRTYCMGCHESGNPDFASAQAEVDFTATSTVNRASACPKCHVPRFVGTHPYHWSGGNCGVCHAGWGPSSITAVPLAATPYGAFVTAASAVTGAEQLHEIHGRAAWPAAAAKQFSHCASCHAVSACSACHENPGTSSTHAAHAAAGSAEATAVTRWPGTVAQGVAGGDEAQVTESPETSRCGAVACHGGPRVQVPAQLRESNPSAGGITLTGVWRTLSAGGYSGGQTMASNVKDSTLALTFTGNRVALMADRGPARGIGDIYIDGAKVATVDLYASATVYQRVVFESLTLAPGSHTIMVRVTGSRNPSATGATVAPDQFKVFSPSQNQVVPTCSSCHPARAATHW